MSDAQQSGLNDPSPGRSSEAKVQRQRIRLAAGQRFQKYGFDRTSLADIGSEVGLTRGAVLYHFGSKAELLAELVRPLMTGLDVALLELEASTPAPEPAAVIDTLLDLFASTPAVVDLLARDIASRHALGLGTSRTQRLMQLLAPGSDADPAEQVRAYAALGALVAPLEHLPDPSVPAVRSAIRRAALGALQGAGE